VSIDISHAFLLDGATDQPVVAELWDAITEQQLVHWEDHWVPALHNVVERMKAAGIERSLLPQSRHWDWRRKAGVFNGSLANPSFSVVCQGMTQGMMILDTLHKARMADQAGKDLIYIEFLENAPWNRRHMQSEQPRFSGVGSLLIRAAIEFSRTEGFKGRIGCHSLPQSNGFYANVCGMTDLGVDTAYQSGTMRYFETTPEQAEAFVKGSKS
jgi:hypothetical protein